MIEIEAPDGTIIEFPAGTPTDTIKQVMRQQYGGPETPSPDLGMGGGQGSGAGASGSFEDPTWVDRKTRALRIGGQGVGEGVAGVLGLPGDLLKMAGDALRTGTSFAVNQAGFPETAADIYAMEGGNLLPTSEELSTAAGNDIRAIFGENALIPEDQMSPGERIAKGANALGTEAVTGGAGIAKALASQGDTVASNLASKLSVPATRDAVAAGNYGRSFASDVAAGAGAGAALQGVQENETLNAIREVSPIAALVTDTLALLAGGGAGAKANDVVRAGARQVPGVVTGPEMPRNVDPETGAPFAPFTADMAAKFMQNDLKMGGPTADTLSDRVRKFAEDGMSPQETPTVGMLLGPENKEAAILERTLRSKNEVPFIQRDQTRREKARGLVEDIATPGDGRAFTDTVDNIAASRLDEAQRKAEADRLAAQETRDLNVSRIEDRAALDLDNARRTREEQVRPLEDQSETAQTSARRASQEVDEFGQQFPDQDSAALMRDNANAQIDDLATGELRDAQTRRSQMYDRLENEFGDTEVPLSGIRQTIEKMAGDGLVKLRDVIPADIANRFLGKQGGDGVEGLPSATGEVGMPDTATVADLTEMRRFLASERQKARTAGDFTKADNIGELSKAINASILAQAKLSDNTDLSRLAKDIDAFETSEFGPRFREGEADRFRKDLNVDPGGRSKAPPSQTADRFVKPNRPENIADLKRMFPQVDSMGGGREALRDKLMADLVLSGAVDRKTGRLKNTVVGDWINKKWGEKTIEQAAPGLVNELRGAVARNESLLNTEALSNASASEAASALATGSREADATLRDRTGEIKRNSASGKRAVESAFANELRGITERFKLDEAAVNKGALRFAMGSSPENAIKSVLGSKDPTRNMKALVDQVRDNPEAMEGMRQSVREYLLDKATNAESGYVRGKDGESARPVSPAKISKIAEEVWPALSEVFDEAQMNDLRKVHDLLKDESILKVQGNIGSPTKLYDVQIAKLRNAVEGLVKLKFGMLKGGGMIRAMRQISEATSGEAVENQVYRLLTQSMLDPELAQHLMKRNVTKAEAPAWNSRLTYLLGAAELSEENEELE